jgi:hypothetical protein
VQAAGRGHSPLGRRERRRGLGEPPRERRRRDGGDEQAHGGASVAGFAPATFSADLL